MIKRASIVAAAALTILQSCRDSSPAKPPEPAKPATVEVGAAPDAALSTETDRVETRHDAAFSGVLPGGFPKDVPTYVPSTLVDFGTGAGWSYVVFQTPQELGLVRGRYVEALHSRGWASEGATGFVKQKRHLRVAFENAHPGSRIRVEYQL
ncbi:MAG: hypothetical protein ABI609_16885 [Acidobacteriota bacterium]